MVQPIKDRVAELEKHNRLLKDNLVDAVWVVNAGTLVYEYITPSVYGFSGYTSEELLGTSIAERLSPDSRKQVKALLEKVLKGYERGARESRTIELEVSHKNGGTYWVEIKAKLVEEPGSPLKIVGVTRDITARKKAEMQMKEQNRKLADALAEKERLLKEIKILRELLPICSGCRRIRDDQGKWWPLDAYVKAKTDSAFTHTICPDCKDIFYPQRKK